MQFPKCLFLITQRALVITIRESRNFLLVTCV